MVLGLPDLHVQARFLRALLSAPNPARTQDGLLAIAHRVFGLYGGQTRLARRPGSIAAVTATPAAPSTLLGTAHTVRETRQAWSKRGARALTTPTGPPTDTTQTHH